MKIPLSLIDTFENHPFNVQMDVITLETIEGVRRIGKIHTPALVRPKPDRQYELISGHRRRLAGETAQRLTAEPSREGWRFVGWDFDFSTVITDNTNIIAEWERVLHTVIFDLVGSSVTLRDMLVPHGGSIQRPTAQTM